MLNNGLRIRQPDSSMPMGKAAFDQPVRKPRQNPHAEPLPSAPGEYLFRSGWEMADREMALRGGALLESNYDSRHWYNATVPGTVLTTLVEQGVYPDPYIGLNNLAIPDTLCRQDWWYRLRFKSPEAPDGRKAWLHVDGINYKAVFYLNGTLLGQIAGAFRRAAFDVTAVLRPEGDNILTVHILPPPNPGIPHEQSKIAGVGPNGGQLCADGPTFIASEGWDWVPGIRDRNIGIWQDVRLRFTGTVTMSDPQVITDLPLPDTTVAAVTVRVNLRNHSDQAQAITLQVAIGDKKALLPVELAPRERRRVELSPATHPVLRISRPRLWWPNGYGSPQLYTLDLQLLEGKGKVSDRASLRFGIREFSYELMADAPHRKAWRFAYSPTDLPVKTPIFDNQHRREIEKRIKIPSLLPGIDTSTFTSLVGDNPFLVIRVNGVRVFCKGGNWGMDDAMKRVGRERLEPYFRLHRDAHFTMIRNWTGECTEEDFYALADEYGLLVWNDYWLSTEGYNITPFDQALFLDNTLDVLRRFRNHASIVVWCPRNEGYAPDGMEETIYRQIMEEDGTRHYNGSSIEINMRQSGDWLYIEDPAVYFTKYADGFTTEIGTFSMPPAETVRKFIKPEDLWPINDVWHYHDFHSNTQNLRGYLRAMDSLYGPSGSMEDLARRAQLVNYESHRTIFEAFQSKRWNRTSGVLLWMSHPAWPSLIWQTYSWDYETGGAYFGAKKGCEPVHVQMNRDDGRILAMNATAKAYLKISVLAEVFDLAGRKQYSATRVIDLPADTVFEAMAPLSAGQYPEGPYMVRLMLRDRRGAILSVNEYWRNGPASKDFVAFNRLPESALVLRVLKTSPGVVRVELSNPSKIPLVGIKLNLCDALGKILLPAYADDGYFTLMPGERRAVDLQFPAGLPAVQIRTEAYNSRSAMHPLR